MSRLNTMSQTAISSLFASETDKDIILLVTIYDPITSQVALRIADGFTTRISESVDDVLYGVTSRGQNYIFIPMEVTLPDEGENSAPKCSLTFFDVTRYVMQIARTISSRPRVKLELVMSSTPDTVEASFDSFYITNFSYNIEKVTADLSMINYELEPFPQHSFSPVYFPGLF